ncbi:MULTISPECIES: porphobilinogen synthase [Desulfofundulus]|uniref:Delta-aminolevulinic acid dehydratase n=1 Tax=Desulfofundulus australicus DSM 11792 TaxID=1121425 RepID=A0A1M5DE32_9FIRM|nr:MULTISPECIES: porphobilinogen synthase [Desulfofundulus]MCS5696383.1 porphobilinogen synthase [Desulfofundulus thermocisternus]SHF65259.1 porphobilinogen synthase [Desulfofundulus australicus DSM 11792]
MSFPITRPRRLRLKENIRRLVRETRLTTDDLIYPLFVTHGREMRTPVEAMPGVYNLSPDLIIEEVARVAELNIPGIIIFGIPRVKDESASEAYDDEGIVQQVVRLIKKEFPELIVITDVCLCEYTSHGHCGIVEQERILNDPTLELLARTALSHARAGADMVAPSDMMDGRVAAIRRALDEAGYQDVAIMSYAAKYASAYYGPFREAVNSAPRFGDRRSYQMDPANAREAMREIALDIEEGADIIMIKPALAYLDIVRRVRDTFNCPVAVYNVSGEYAMVKAAAMRGWIDERRVVLETLTGMKRAGADMIITYHALDVARWLREG